MRSRILSCSCPAHTESTFFRPHPATSETEHYKPLFIYLFSGLFSWPTHFVSRKLTANGRSAVEARSISSQADAELEREEEEMLAMTRRLKQVDETEAVSVAKKMLLEAGGGSELSNGARVESSVNGHSEDSVTRQQDDTTVAQPSHGKRLQSTYEEGSCVFLAGQSGESEILLLLRVHEKPFEACFSSFLTPNLCYVSLPFLLSPVNGSASASNGSTAEPDQNDPRWVGNLTVENVERQNDTHEKERLEQSQDQDRDSNLAQQEPCISAVGGSTVADESGDTAAKRSSLCASARKTTQSQDGHNGASTDASSRPARGVSSARSDVSDNFSSNDSITSSLAANLPVVFRPDEVEGSTSAIVSGFEMPIKDLTQPRLSQALISRKARTIYAPEATKIQPVPASPENVKRRPGRPPGYFLGPTSCAFCRQQHRRCDYNTVCHRCIKAKIPCDRSGTVERPSIIVREARIQAKAEAAAVLELAVAAGFAEHPDPKAVMKPKSRATTAASRSSARVQNWDQGSSESLSSVTRESVKRRRSPSPSSISRDNIIQLRVKRVAAARGVKGHEPNSPSKSSRATAASRSRAESSSSRHGPSSISTSEDGQLEVIESDFADYNDDHTSTQADEAISTASNPTSSSSISTAPQIKPKVPLGSSTVSKFASHAATVQRAYKSAAELARIAPPNALQKPVRVRVRVAKTADTTGKRKAGRPPGGKFVATSAHLTPANQAILIRAQSVTNPQVVEPETMRMMMMLKRRPGRPPWKHTLPQPDPVVKRPVGRPTNAERFALNPSLIPPPKTLDPNRRGPGRPIRSPNTPNAPTSSSTQAKSLIPAQSSKSNSSKATPATSKSVIPAKRSHSTVSANQAQASNSSSAAFKGKSVASRAVVDTAVSTP